MIKRIIEAYHKAKEAQKRMGSVYQPAPMWEHFITLRKPLIDALNGRDEATVKELMDNLFRNGSSAFITDYNLWLFVKENNEDGIQLMMDKIEKELKTWGSYTNYEYPISDLATPKIGNPYGCLAEGTMIMPAFPRYHYYAQKIKALLDGVDKPVVAEMGGGLCVVAYYLTRDSNIQYIDYDLPEILVMGQYYLMSAFPERKFLLYGEEPTEEHYDYIMMPHFELRNMADKSCDVFINFHSLSEVTPETIKEYIPHIVRVSNGYFYHENAYTGVLLFNEYKEISERSFKVPKDEFVRISITPNMWGENLYREYLYKRRKQ